MSTNNEILNSAEFLQIAKEIAEVAGFLSGKGWTPATSSNFSAVIPGSNGFIAVSKSGVEKDAFSVNDVMVVDGCGNPLAPLNCEPSAETLIHASLYNDPCIGAVLHTHSVSGTVVSVSYADQNLIKFSGLEILKGLHGNETHESEEMVPIFRNSQDMPALSREIENYKNGNPNMAGFLIEGHGLYTWGRDLKDAKRHVEVFEFLFEYLLAGGK